MANNMLMRGSVKVFGDNVDTDVIAPPDLLFGVPGEAEVERVRLNAFRAVRTEFYKEVKKGDILIGGKNFGFGSHREQANTALPILGFQAVVAESFARIYFRNSLAIGFPIFEIHGVSKLFREGDIAQIDQENCSITNLTTNESLPMIPHTGIVKKMVQAGSIFNMMRQTLEEEKRRKRG